MDTTPKERRIVAKAEPDSEVPHESFYMGPIVESLGNGLFVMEPERYCAPPDPWCDYTGVKLIMVKETSEGPWEYVDNWLRRKAIQ